jgi:hypothetical protein
MMIKEEQIPIQMPAAPQTGLVEALKDKCQPKQVPDMGIARACIQPGCQLRIWFTSQVNTTSTRAYFPKHERQGIHKASIRKIRGRL